MAHLPRLKRFRQIFPDAKPDPVLSTRMPQSRQLLDRPRGFRLPFNTGTVYLFGRSKLVNCPRVVQAAANKLPMLVTGGSQQDPDWIARNSDGWMMYPRDPGIQSRIIRNWHARGENTGSPAQPVMQPLYIDLVEDSIARPQPIHLGLRLGARQLRDYLKSLQAIGVNHVALNLRFNQADIETTLNSLADEVLPDFSE